MHALCCPMASIFLPFVCSVCCQNRYDPTIEDSYCKHIEVDGEEYTLDVIDTAGQHEYRGHWNDQFLR